jgi:hypothetical protein
MGAIPDRTAQAGLQEGHMRVIDVPNEKREPEAGRAEARAILTRLLVRLYVDRHQDLIREAA